MIRIFEEQALQEGITIISDKVHYLNNVMRSKVGDDLIIVNGKDGEFLGTIQKITKREVGILINKKTKEYKKDRFLGLIFSPIHKIDLLIKNAIELGTTDLIPFKAQYKQEKFKFDKVKANVIEAIEQCERTDFPNIENENTLENILSTIENENGVVLFCEERSTKTINLKNYIFDSNKKYYILVGCEGGFSDNEKRLIKSFSCVTSISLGEHILRAENATSAGISIVKYLMEN